jgi:ketosteroid isomerase-like protein
MKRCLLIGLMGLVISLALPVFGQDQHTVSADVRQQIEAVFVKFEDAYNNRDAAGIGALLTHDAAELRSGRGWAVGQEAIVKRFEFDFAGNPGKMVNTIVQMYPIGHAVCVIADTAVGDWKGQTVTIYVRDDDNWKWNMTYVGETP